MNLSQLPKTTTTSHKRPGRGYGSGKGGHTSSRGQKGQKSRNSVKIWFEGGQLPLSRRLPFLRGKSRFAPLVSTTISINLDRLNKLKPNTTVDKQTLIDHKLITLKEAASSQVKILGRGNIDFALTIKDIPVSANATKKITKAGGKVIDSKSPQPTKKTSPTTSQLKSQKVTAKKSTTA